MKAVLDDRIADESFGKSDFVWFVRKTNRAIGCLGESSKVTFLVKRTDIATHCCPQFDRMTQWIRNNCVMQQLDIEQMFRCKASPVMIGFGSAIWIGHKPFSFYPHSFKTFDACNNAVSSGFLQFDFPGRASKITKYSSPYFGSGLLTA